MNQGDTQRGRDQIQMMGSEGRSVVDIELSGKPPAQDRLLESLQKTPDVFVKKERTVWNQPGVIVDKGDEIGLFELAILHDMRAMHQPSSVQEAINGLLAKLRSFCDQSSASGLLDQQIHRCSGHFFA